MSTLIGVFLVYLAVGMAVAIMTGPFIAEAFCSDPDETFFAVLVTAWPVVVLCGVACVVVGVASIPFVLAGRLVKWIHKEI